LTEDFREIETDGGFFEGPGQGRGRRQVNGLEGFVERVFKLKADVFI